LVRSTRSPRSLPDRNLVACVPAHRGPIVSLHLWQRRIGESAELDTPPSEVLTSEKLNKAEIDPPPPDTSTALPEEPSELDALEDIFYL